jgi:hypothetical protein
VTSPVESFVTATARTQEAASSVLRSWVDGLQSFAAGPSAKPDLPTMVGSYFDALHQVLESQRHFAETWVRVAHSTQDLVNQAVHAAEQTSDVVQSTADQAAHDAADGAATVNRVAKEETAALAQETSSLARTAGTTSS